MSVTINGTTGIAGVDGSASIPAYQGADTNTGIAFPAADTVSVATGGTERMRVDSAGHVLVGLTSSVGGTNGAALQVKGLTGSSDFSIALMDNDTTVGGRLHLESTGSNSIALQADPDNLGASTYLGFGVDGTERMRIDSSGNLLVGTTSTSPTSGVGTKILGGNVSVVNTGQDGFDFYNTTAGAYRFYVQANGTIAATNTTISAISDQRFKENIRDLDVGLAEIMQLRPRVFDWKEGKGKNTQNDRGFIAQEVEQVFPDLIDEWKDPAPEGEEPYKSVRQDLIPVLVKAIQELKAELDTVKATNELLTARIEALEASNV